MENNIAIESAKKEMEEKNLSVLQENEQLKQKLIAAERVAMIAKGEIELETTKVSVLTGEVEDLKHQLKVTMDWEKDEVARFMLYQKIKVIKEMQAGGPNLYDADKLIDEFDEEGWSWPSFGRGGGEYDEVSEDEEEVNSALNPPKGAQDASSTDNSKAKLP